MKRVDLLQELGVPSGGGHASTAALTDWLTASRRFTAFTAENLPKIRKKLRTAADPQSLAEVLFELEVAYRLVELKALRLEYEPYAGAKERGPDFLAWRGEQPLFLLEVTRLSAGGDEALTGRLTRALLMKLGQLRAGTPNVLLVGVEDDVPTAQALADLVADTVRRVESADPEALARWGFSDKGAFFKQFERLTLLLVRGHSEGKRLAHWDNPRAKRPLPGKSHTELLAALG